MMKDNPNIEEVYLCLDNDEPGQVATKRISEKLLLHGVPHEILIPIRKELHYRENGSATSNRYYLL